MGAKPVPGSSRRSPVRSDARHGYLFLPGGAVGLPGGSVGFPGGAVGFPGAAEGLWLALADGVAVADGVEVGGVDVGSDVGLGGAGRDPVGLGPLVGWLGIVISASTVLR